MDDSMTGNVPFPDRDTVAEKLAALSETDKSYVALLMENAAQDDNLLDGLRRHLDLAAGSRFLNSLKLENLGIWLGTQAPDRLQIRLMETARSSQHPAYQAFRTGLDRSGGLEKVYPRSSVRDGPAPVIR
ncbi:hypothetical protein [Rhizobium leguminosarum]|uniref:hypothetical protein n=1 Tax=Rhizobium leguminosarum TaxID=384 RepID=UPI001AA0B04D|nr:hypothetical protein [Rhizobium leguminosarum]